MNEQKNMASASPPAVEHAAPVTGNTEDSGLDSPRLVPLTKEGIWAAATTGFGENYLAPYALSLGASTFQMGLLSSFPFVVSGSAQLLGLRLSERGVSRRRVCYIGSGVQSLIWLPIALLSFLSLPSSILVPLFLLLTAIHFAMNGLLGPLWNSLVGDIIPPKIRPLYLGLRTRVITLSSLGAFVFSGLLLEVATHYGVNAWGFVVLFVAAFLCRARSSSWLGRYEDVSYLPAKEEAFTFKQFLLKSEDSNFARFVLFISMFNFAASVSSVYIPLYMIRDAKLSYMQFMIVEAAQLLFQAVTFSRWGRLIEQYGAKRILSVSSAGNALIPFLFLFSSSFWALLVMRSFAGFVWSGYALASSTFLFDAVTPKHRTRCAAYQGLVNSVLVFIGAAVGGLLANVIPSAGTLDHDWMGTSSSLLTVFLISGFFRVAMLPFLSSFKEVRKVGHAPHLDVLFRASMLRPLTATILPMVATEQERAGSAMAHREIPPDDPSK